MDSFDRDLNLCQPGVAFACGHRRVKLGGRERRVPSGRERTWFSALSKAAWPKSKSAAKICFDLACMLRSIELKRVPQNPPAPN